MLRKGLLLISILCLASCTVRTNLGGYVKSQAQTEARSQSVEVYGANEIFSYNTRFLGQVESDFCQNERFAELPSKSQLQRTLKAKAQKLGGNGIVYGQCKTGRFYTGCDKYMSCEGSVYFIEF
ncbi:Rcs stress response system protein RcsF [Shewanella maritima]|uniref:Rcs stress response system protein RcsF n=1 Tax=Shewanella maritima TaxID=2520507 RepID=UPI0037356C6D